MVLAVVALLGGLLAGLASGGRLDRLGHLELRRPGLLAAALLVQLAGALVGGPFYPAGLALSALLAAAFLAGNRGVRGTGLVALGLLANALVVGLNGAMPVSQWASGRAGVSTQDLVSGADPRHEAADRSTRLRPLGDVVPVLLPWHPEVVSPGDVLVAAGLAQVVFLGLRAGSEIPRVRTLGISRGRRRRRAVRPGQRSPDGPAGRVRPW